MLRVWRRHLTGLLLIIAVLVTGSSPHAVAQKADDLAELMNQVLQLGKEERYREAIPIAQKALAVAETTLGAEHPTTLIIVKFLGLLYMREGRYTEAEPLHQRALSVERRIHGEDHPDTLTALNALAELYMAKGRYKEAEPLFRRCLEARERVLGKENDATLKSVGNLALVLQAQGQYAEAESLYKQAVETQERIFGKEDQNTLTAIGNLASLYHDIGRYNEAEALYRHALEARERTLGSEHPDTLLAFNNLAVLYQAQGRYGEAQAIFERVLSGREKVLGPEHPNTLTSVNNLAALYEAQGRYAEAEPLYKRALAGREAALGPEHPSTLLGVSNLGGLYETQGRYAEAELLYKRALAGRETALGPEHRDTLTSVNNLGVLYGSQGRYSEAEPLYKRALVGREAALGPEHPDTLTSVNNLAALYLAQGRYDEAEPLYQRALAGREKALGSEHPDTLTSVNNLGFLHERQGRYGEAEPLYKRALASREAALGPEHPDTLSSVNNLAALYDSQGRYAEAEPLYRRALAGIEKVLGPEHPLTLASVNNLGFLYSEQGRYGEAEPLYQRALTGKEKVLGPEHPDTLGSVNNLAVLSFAQRDWQRAAQYWRRGTAAIVARTRRGVEAPNQTLTGKQKSEVEQQASQFRNLVRAVYHLPVDGGASDRSASSQMFETAQWALSSEAALSLTQMAVRGAKGDPVLATLVRERQDLVDEWQAREKIQTAALGRETAKRNANAEAESRTRMAAIDRRIVEIDGELKDKFPGYAALANPAPLAVEDAQAQLGADEALVLFLDTPELKTAPEETFIWVVTRTEARWVRSDLGTKALEDEVHALRCGLDGAAWDGRSRCPELTGRSRPGQLLPFDHARAHRLYQALFGQAEDLIKSKHLLIVPSGALTQLPFAVLETAPPKGDNRSAAWLARDHAITVLPAVSSLKALRATGRPSAAAKPLIGFGNPLLDGDGENSPAARLARAKQACPKTAWQRAATLFGSRQAVAPIETYGGLADVSLIRRLAPLPETADELCAVASDLGADASEIRLGGHATERAVKALSEAGKLAHYRVIHVATHGAMAGELSSKSEPGLILTPPAEASEDDDGYLTASEIAALKLDADWVILSACNTAAGNAANAEALSGLARAFIYAQARALLVSHWAVNSNATVKLITTAMREIARDKSTGRAEALRRAMIAMIDHGKPYEAHPAYWAPFIVVGEGAH